MKRQIKIFRQFATVFVSNPKWLRKRDIILTYDYVSVLLIYHLTQKKKKKIQNQNQWDVMKATQQKKEYCFLTKFEAWDHQTSQGVQYMCTCERLWRKIK